MVLAALAAIALASAGCAAVAHSYDLAPNGLTRRDDTLRRLLAGGRADTALARLTAGQVAPDDDLLGLLYTGLAAHYAGQLDLSAAALERAGDLADDRITKSVSRSALSVVASELALPFAPLRSERLLIPYYAALTYLRAGRLQDAVVEARRLSALLQRAEAEGPALDAEFAGFLRLFAGEVFRAAGEENDAGVAFRNAERLLGRAAAPIGAGADSGDVVVLLENGFVAHRVEQGVTVGLLEDELAALSSDVEDRRAETAGSVAGRVLAQLGSPSDTWWSGRRREFSVAAPATEEKAAPVTAKPADSAAATSPAAGQATPAAARAPDAAPVSARAPEAAPAPAAAPEAVTAAIDRTRVQAARPRHRHGHEGRGPLVRLAWPTYRLDRPPATQLRVLAEQDTVSAEVATDVSGAVAGDFERQRPAIMARLIVRATGRLALARSLKAAAGEKHETTGEVLKTLTELSGLVLERADTRSWQLLPGRLSLARLRLPAGSHALSAEALDQGVIFRYELGLVQVQPGGVAFVQGRIWR